MRSEIVVYPDMEGRILCLAVVEVILDFIPVDKDAQLLGILHGHAPVSMARAGVLEHLIDHVLDGLASDGIRVEGIGGGLVCEGDVGELGNAGRHGDEDGGGKNL